MAEPTDPTTRPGSPSRQICAALREGNIRGRYPQGIRLAEQRLAEKLQVSRVPLREAVPLLAIDGFVSTLPRRSAIVTTWTIASAHGVAEAVAHTHIERDRLDSMRALRASGRSGCSSTNGSAAGSEPHRADVTSLRRRSRHGR